MPQLVWLITGCSSGFGEIFVRQLLERGDLVIATARRPERIQHLAKLGAAALQLDVTDSQQTIRERVAAAVAVHGRIDVLVNNAAYIATGAWEDLEYVPHCPHVRRSFQKMFTGSSYCLHPSPKGICLLTDFGAENRYEQFLAQFETNVFGAIKVTKAVLPHFRERRAGTNVFISSRSGWCGDPFCSAYSGSKFALEGKQE